VLEGKAGEGFTFYAPASLFPCPPSHSSSCFTTYELELAILARFRPFWWIQLKSEFESAKKLCSARNKHGRDCS
jgi:hypothetical protein